MNRASDKQVLYVDDETQALKYFKQLFGDQFNIVVAESAEEAWDYVQEHSADLAVVVTDQRMPGKTGTELMEQLRVFHPNIVRVLTTAYSDLDSAVKSVNEGGAFRYLTKPWQAGEMVGTLLRAIEFHDVTQQRDTLLNEKLSMLHRLVIMDRVRGLATTATAMDGRIRNAWQALVSYMEHSAVLPQLRLQIDEITEMNMTAVARQEAEQMVKTVEMIRSVGVESSTSDESNVDVGALLRELSDSVHEELAADDLQLKLDSPESVVATTDRGLLKELVTIMTRRMADIQDQPAAITIAVAVHDEQLHLTVQGDFADLAPDQCAAFFAAAMPLKKWPIGLDMDLLGAYMITHHLGGSFEVQSAPPSLKASLPIQYQAASQSPRDPNWFDTVFASLQEWENALSPLAD